MKQKDKSQSTATSNFKKSAHTQQTQITHIKYKHKPHANKTQTTTSQAQYNT